MSTRADDPFKPANATLIRPKPGAGKRTPSIPPLTAIPGVAPSAPRAQPSPEPWISAPALPRVGGQGLNPLVTAAAPLLLMAGGMRGSAIQGDVPAAPAGGSLASRSVVPAGDSLAGRSVGGSLAPALDEESSLDPIVALGLPEARRKAPSAPRAEHLASGSPLQSHFEPPRMAQPEGSGGNPEKRQWRDAGKSERDRNAVKEIPRSPDGATWGESAPWVPQDYNPLVQPEVETDTAESGPPAAAPSLPPPDVGLAASPRRSSDTLETLDFAALLAAAGLEGVPVTAELSANFGSILKVVLDGLRDMLRAREELKEQFRVPITTYQPRENNPIKFSANTPDALHNLLVKRNAAYLGPVAAFEEAFEDLRIHQLAIVAGLRAAYEAMLGNFDPHTLETRFERYVKRGNLLAGGAKQRYWELYADTFADLVRDPTAGFQTLFGEAFSKAYEEQARLLKPRAPSQ